MSAEETLEQDQFERLAVYEAEKPPDDSMSPFKERTGNTNYRQSTMTWGSLFILLLFYPAISVGFTDDPTAFLKELNEGLRMVVFVSTIIIQWAIFFFLWFATYRENTLLAGIGLVKIRLVDFSWAVAFLLASNLILSGLAWFLAQVGLPMPGEIGLLIPEDTPGRITWVAVSFTAGFCEEAAFRGYLMTRLRLTFKLQNWVIPTIVSSVAFGICHAYQGIPGFIVITTYGAMFALLYIRTGSLWPCVIAHSLQDFSALFIPQ